MQLPLFKPESKWKPPQMSRLPSWKKAKRVCIDAETRDEDLKRLGIGVRRNGYVVGWSFKIEDGPGFYLPIRHAEGDNLDAKKVVEYLKKQAAEFTGEIVGAKLDYDLDYAAQEGIEFKQAKSYRDVLVAEACINELEHSFSLESTCERRGIEGKDEKELIEAASQYCTKAERKLANFHKKFLWRLPGRYVGLYGEGDTDRPLRILRKQEKIFDEVGLWSIWNLESQVLPVLVRIRRRGILIDQDHLSKVEKWSIDEEAKALAVVKDITGYSIGSDNLWKADALAPALHAVGIKLEKTSQGRPQIDKDVLAEINHPVPKAIAHARKVNKLRTTFAASIRKYMTNGRIHCTFNQMRGDKDEDDVEQGGTGVRYGRLSCVHPNLQQQPGARAGEEFAAFWRKVYKPEPGAIWNSNDYSQQEPRWTTHFAAVTNQPGAAEACAAYLANPKLDNHQFMADTTGLPRKFAKNLYLGLCYGEGGAKLCHDIGLPTRWALVVGRGRERKTYFYESQFEAYKAGREFEHKYIYEAAGEEGQKVIDAFDARAPFIRKLAKQASDTAKRRGYIITIEGRHLHFPLRVDGSYDWLHKALNRLIQGSSADQVKKAMVELDRAGHFIQLQVHDEINSSVADIAEGRKIASVMENIIPARLPFRVDPKFGSSWGEVKEAA